MSVQQDSDNVLIDPQRACLIETFTYIEAQDFQRFYCLGACPSRIANSQFGPTFLHFAQRIRWDVLGCLREGKR